jgi:MazG family protein
MNDRRKTFGDLIAIMARLRGPEGCPWDRQQTHESLRPYLLEETYETLDAISARSPERLCEELGDLLLQVVFHAQMAADAGQFTIDDVVAGLAEKLIRRHPHVFGETTVSGPGEVLTRWEEIKREERAQTHSAGGDSAAPHGPADGSVLDGLPRTLPALALAQQIQARAAQTGFAWPGFDAAAGKLREELGELEAAVRSGSPDRAAEELGDLLLAAANLPRYLGVNGELVLREACDTFRERFTRLEARAQASGRALHDYTPDELLALWRAAR